MSTLEREKPLTETREDSVKRRQILEGARRAFLANGFDASSMSEIAREAGVSKGTLYVYFKSNAKMMADTTIMVGTEAIECRQAQHTITAKASITAPDDVSGTIVARTYISAKYGKVILDFVHSGKFEGVYKGKVRGVYKIMTFHE